jgi:shikimate kinase
MILFLAGTNCVGKTTMGPIIAADLGCEFYDLDHEMERFYQCKLAFLGKVVFAEPHEFRGAMSEVVSYLIHLLTIEERNAVIALNPPGLMNPVWDVLNMFKDKVIVHVHDDPANIVDRVIYFDENNKRIHVRPSPYMKQIWLEQISSVSREMASSWKRADIKVDIAGCDAQQAARKVLDAAYPLFTKQRDVVSGKVG